MKQPKKPVHSWLQHDYNFHDIIDKGTEIHKVYDCSCGKRKIEVYTLLKEYEIDKKEVSHDETARRSAHSKG